jgi:DNA-directed RNA polymerase specialized sigma24 family protein
MKIELEQYITKNYYELLKIAKKYTKNDDWASELLHEVILQMYNQKEFNCKTDDNSIKYYIIRIIMVNWCYPSSPFYRKYKNYNLNAVDLKGFEMQAEEMEAFESEEIYKLLEENYSELDWFRKSLFDMYLSLNKSMIAVSRKTNIPFQSISRYIKSARQEVKTNVIKGLNN